MFSIWRTSFWKLHFGLRSEVKARIIVVFIERLGQSGTVTAIDKVARPQPAPPL